MPGRGFLRLRLGQVLPDQLNAGMRESRQRLQLLLADAVPQEGQNHHGKRGSEGHDALLPGQLHADRCAEGFDNWLKGTAQVGQEGDTLYVSVPDRETRAWLETEYSDRKSTRLNSSHLGISYCFV